MYAGAQRLGNRSHFLHRAIYVAQADFELSMQSQAGLKLILRPHSATATIHASATLIFCGTWSMFICRLSLEEKVCEVANSGKLES